MYLRGAGTFPATFPMVTLDSLLTRNGSLQVSITKDDANLATNASMDPVTNEHASDHRPVCGELVDMEHILSTGIQCK